MSLRGWLKRLEHAARGEFIEIPLEDGTVARFPQSTAAEAFLCMCEGRDHPLLVAARNSPDTKWSESIYSTVPVDRSEVEDLSE